MRTIASISLPLALVVTWAATLFGQSEGQFAHRFQLKPSPTIVHGTPSSLPPATLVNNSPLPLWNYQVISSRDGNVYQGVIVGRNPQMMGSHSAVSVPTQVVPVILNFQSIATSVDLNTGIITTTSGSATSNPAAPDTACFTGTDNIPLELLAQSPMFQNADFNFGGTDVGTTQYTDAFQRANFWSEIDKANYHVRLGPVQILKPVILNVPASMGLSLPANIFQPLFSMCGPEGIVNIDTIDSFVVSELSQLPGVTPGTFPMFMMYNTGMSLGDPTNLANCCAGGYHSINPVTPLTFQTYSPFDFDVSGFFVSSANDTAIVSHEAAEWMNDPYIANATPAWGNTGQVIGCQANLEVGDPLTGSLAPRIAMPNGYTYDLQELAFFSWFFGAPSLGIHGWYSDNATFQTDAGPVCQ